MTYFGANPPAQCPATSQALQLRERCSPRSPAWIRPSPPEIPSGEIWLAGGRGCPCSSGEITEISPHHSAAFLCGALARRAARDLLVSSARGDELGAERLCWSVLHPWLLQICSSGLGPALLLNAKRHIFMRGRCFSPPACPTALPCLWGILSLCCSVWGAVCQGRCTLSQKQSREEVKRAPAPV